MNKEIDMEMASQMVKSAEALLSEYGENINHTVAASILSKDGEIISALNLYHFTGGPCAELSVLAKAISSGSEPVAIVAVGDRKRGIIEPCGRCRQVLIDYCPEIKILIKENKVLPISSLLPYSYVLKDQ